MKSHLLPIALVAASAASLAGASASAQVLERFSLRLEASGGLIVGGREPARRFGAGFEPVVGVGVHVIGPLHVQLNMVNQWFAPSGGGALGRAYAFTGGVRIAPRLARGMLGGPVFELNAGVSITGGGQFPAYQRFTFDAAIGWQFQPLSFFAIGPMIRYGHIYQPDNLPPDPDDVMMTFFGVGITLTPPPRRSVVQIVHDAAPPPGDQDHDGIFDDNDRCPAQPEDADGFQDADGCPEPDNDGDGFADAADHCPDQPETRNEFQDDDGCPDTAPPPLSANARRVSDIGEHILFDTASNRLPPAAETPIEELCRYMRVHPEIVRLRVEGHADERGAPDANQELSSMRAVSVTTALVRCGLSPDRIESAGMGESRLLCTASADECHRRNRRVRFQLVEDATRAPSSAAPTSPH